MIDKPKLLLWALLGVMACLLVQVQPERENRPEEPVRLPRDRLVEPLLRVPRGAAQPQASPLPSEDRST